MEKQKTVFWAEVFRSGVGQPPTPSILGYVPDSSLPLYTSSLEILGDTRRILIYRGGNLTDPPLYRINLGALSVEQGLKMASALVQTMFAEDRQAAKALRGLRCLCGRVSEGYALHPLVLAEVAQKVGQTTEQKGELTPLCFACTESRLGRPLTPQDFKPEEDKNLPLLRMFERGFIRGYEAGEGKGPKKRSKAK